MAIFWTGRQDTQSCLSRRHMLNFYSNLCVHGKLFRWFCSPGHRSNRSHCEIHPPAARREEISQVKQFSAIKAMAWIFQHHIQSICADLTQLGAGICVPGICLHELCPSLPLGLCSGGPAPSHISQLVKFHSFWVYYSEPASFQSGGNFVLVGWGGWSISTTKHSVV